MGYTCIYFEFHDLLLTGSSAFSGMMNSIWSSRTSAANLTESNPAFYNYKLLGLYTINILVWFKLHFEGQSLRAISWYGSTLQSGTVFQNGSRMEPFWLPFFLSDGQLVLKITQIHSFWRYLLQCNSSTKGYLLIRHTTSKYCCWRLKTFSSKNRYLCKHLHFALIWALHFA